MLVLMLLNGTLLAPDAHALTFTGLSENCQSSFTSSSFSCRVDSSLQRRSTAGCSHRRVPRVLAGIPTTCVSAQEPLCGTHLHGLMPTMAKFKSRMRSPASIITPTMGVIWESAVVCVWLTIAAQLLPFLLSFFFDFDLETNDLSRMAEQQQFVVLQEAQVPKMML